MKQDWDVVSSFIDSVGTTDKTVTFPKTQESVKVRNAGNANLTYTIGTQTGTLAPGQSVTVNESLTSFTIRSASNVQPFEVRGWEAGTEKDEQSIAPDLGGIQTQVDDLTSQLAERATKEEVDNKVAQIVSGSPKGTYATLTALQTAFPTGTTGVYVVTADGKWYYWNGTAWTAGGVYQSAGIGKEKVKIDNLNKDVFSQINYKEISAKTTSSSSIIQYELMFDLNDITGVIDSTSKMQVVYKGWSNDPNVISFGSRIFLNNVGTLFDISAASSFTDLYSVNKNGSDVVFYDTTRENYVTGNRYAHVYVIVGLTDKLLKSTFDLADVEFLVGGNKGTMLSEGLRDVNSDKVITQKTDYLPQQLVTNQRFTDELNAKTSYGGSRLVGKVWNVLGDSITAVNPAYTSKSYHEYTKEILGIGTVNNYGISGSQYCKYDEADTKNSMALRYPTMSDTADIITVFGGVNDADYQNPVGTMDDRVATTFYGACHLLYLGLIEKYPTKKIGIITPLKTSRFVQSRLETYVNIEKEVAHYYGLPVLDLFNEGGIYPYSTTITTALIPDGLHPNTEGHRLLGDKIASFINRL